MLKGAGVILDCVWCRRVTVLFRIVFGAEEWRCKLGLCLVLKNDGVI